MLRLIVTSRFKFFFNVFVCYFWFVPKNSVFYEMTHFLLKSQTNGHITKCMEESCPATFDNCFGIKHFLFKCMVIYSKSFVSFFCWNVKVNSLVSLILPNHLSFVLGLKSLFSLLITNPTERRSFLTSPLTNLAISKPQNTAMPSSI